VIAGGCIGFMRIEKHPILTFERGKEIYFTFDGKRIKAFEGETIAAALHADGIIKYNTSPKLHRPRGLFCAVGHCSSCLMTVNGIPNTRICVTRAEEGMIVHSQNPRGDLND